MGILYLAIEPGLERRVALKLIAPEAAADEVFRKRFAEESKIAASIEHPNVVPIYAAGEEGGVPYIAMRYVAGSDLARRVAREGRLEPAEAAPLIAQVGNGLDAIHAAGLVHRDVKPANVLLSGDEGAEHAYITDFGVARNVAGNSGITQTGRFVGTLDYVAPEQISGGEVDARADVYALGCLLFKLLTGEVPYPKDGRRRASTPISTTRLRRPRCTRPRCRLRSTTWRSGRCRSCRRIATHRPETLVARPSPRSAAGGRPPRNARWRRALRRRGPPRRSRSPRHRRKRRPSRRPRRLGGCRPSPGREGRAGGAGGSCWPAASPR
jgi:serine/threonine protein kinase